MTDSKVENEVDDTYIYEPAIVIDNGSYNTKAGYAGHDSPQAIFRSIIGREKCRCGYICRCSHHYFVGNEAFYRNLPRIRHPMQNRTVQNWDDMEKIWHYTFYSALTISPYEYNILMTESSLTPNKTREKQMQIMFETFNVPKYLSISSEAVAVYLTGRTSAIALNIGHSSLTVAPIIDGVTMKFAADTASAEIGGEQALDYLNRLMTQKYSSWYYKRKILRDIKHELGYIALDYNAELRKFKEDQEETEDYELPDGRVVSVGAERFNYLFVSSIYLNNPMVVHRQFPHLLHLLQISSLHHR